jgi:gamma-glutamyltranspeptidase/glutathione hydrolase
MLRRHALLHLLTLLALLCGLTAPAAPQAIAHRHMVAAAHPLAVDAGLAVLRRGGSAVDAAIAVQMVLAVVEPQASGLGGGGFLLHYAAADQRLLAYDGREAAPAGSTPGLFLKPDGTPLPFPQAVIGGASVGVPGLLRLLDTAHRLHGRLPWQELFTPAIVLAEDGFAVPPRLARALAQEKALQASTEARQVYFGADGTPAAEGERIANPALAGTMRTLAAEGAEAFYRGPIAEDIVRAVQTAARPGTLSLADLATWRPIVREPVCGAYRVWILCGMPPPSSGPLAVLQALAMLEPFDLAREPPNSLRSAHLIAEASRLAFADRALFVADPDFVSVPVRELLDRGYLSSRAALISEQRAMAEVVPGSPAPGRRGALDASVEIPATSHITVVDETGNVVSFTTTIEGPFGSRLFVRGFPLNNELTDFSFLPERDGTPVANRVQPGKRPRSSMSPMIVLDRDRRFVMALGSAGGSRIIGDVLHTAIAVLGWDLPMQQAIALPRVLDRNEALELEAGTAVADHAETLRAMGHKVQVQAHTGGLSGIRRRGALLEGGADPRRDGVAKGD